MVWRCWWCVGDCPLFLLNLWACKQPLHCHCHIIMYASSFHPPPPHPRWTDAQGSVALFQSCRGQRELHLLKVRV